MSPPHLRRKTGLTLAGARAILEAALAEAERNGWHAVIAIVEESAHLVLVARMDEAHLSSLELAVGKARTAVLARTESGKLEHRVLEEGKLSLLAAGDLLPLKGGLPIVVEGAIVGAVGVSGLRSVQDEQVARAGLVALGA
jgi:glc operon protein GlcG